MRTKEIVISLIICCAGLNSANSQYCTAVGPSQTTWSNVENTSLIGEIGSFLTYTGCPGVTGLQDLTLTQIVFFGPFK